MTVRAPKQCYDWHDLDTGDPQHMPRNGWSGGWRWPHREAHVEGRQRLPQIQGKEEQLAQGMLQSQFINLHLHPLCSMCMQTLV